MGPAYYVIAILGCADGAAACTPVATVPTRYESIQACTDALAPALAARTDFDFPTLTAQCSGVTRPVASSDDRTVEMPAGALRG